MATEMLPNDKLNPDVIVLENAETKIRQIVKDEYFNKTPKLEITSKIKQVIKKSIKELKTLALKKIATVSLIDFYERQYKEISNIDRQTVNITRALYALQFDKNTAIKNLQSLGVSVKNGVVDFPRAHLYGVPMQQFSKNYIEQYVNPTIERLAQQFPYDPESDQTKTKYINSLRAKAEIEVRHQEHIDMLDALKNKKVNLVIVSSHADCSTRCAKFQNKVFSLDGTSGTTSDGRNFEPIENATDIYVTTKKGKTYKNGLFGFNCRHFVVPYRDNLSFPPPNAKVERKEREITAKQRMLEREVRKWKIIAVENKGINKEKYLFAKEQAKNKNAEYEKFSRDNNRAFYPSRTKIL